MNSLFANITLSWTSYRIAFEATDDLFFGKNDDQRTNEIDYPGSALRGWFMDALKHPSNHEFGAWLNGDFPPAIPALERFTDLPKPYILLPAQPQKTKYEQGERFEFFITIINQYRNTRQQLWKILNSLERIPFHGVRMKWQVFEEYHPDYFGNCPDELPQQHIQLHTHTHIRIVEKGHLLQETLPFELLVERLWQRVRLLAVVYGQNDPALLSASLPIPDVSIAENELNWVEWSRYSTKPKANQPEQPKGWMKFGGLMGRISYTGNWQPYLPLLVAGEDLHVGQNYVMGMGKYSLSLA